jgi:D-alanine--poly(phosphoribitol) ligase subunit 1
MNFIVDKLKYLDSNTTIRGQTAVAGENRDLTWAEFIAAHEKIATLISNRPIPNGHPVIIYARKEAEIIPLISACLQLGIPYIPLDVSSGIFRLNSVIELSGSRVIFTNTNVSDLPREKLDLIFSLDGSEIFDRRNDLHSIYDTGQLPLAYIMFTSGSTGMPKGVKIPVEAVQDFAHWIETDFKFSGRTYINQAPIGFDLSVFEIYAFLSGGGCLILNHEEIYKDSKAFFNRIKHYGGDVWVSTPSFAAMHLASPLFNEENLETLKNFVFCGEVLSKDVAEKLMYAFPSADILNSYGPTEATMAITRVKLEPYMLHDYEHLPLGKVKATTTVSIVREKQSDIAGEIVIKGPNVGCGYVADIQENEKFDMANKARSYRTGDQGYFFDDLLFFAGRNDRQIKLNGFRIELDEIDSIILSTREVRESRSLPVFSKEKIRRIVSFVILERDISRDALREEISRMLPSYMVPSEIVIVNSFPVTERYKVDEEAMMKSYVSGEYNGS